MNQKYDWIELKVKFMTGSYKSLKEFAEKHEIPYSGNFRRMTKGWLNQKVSNRASIGTQIAENFIKDEMEKLVEINQKILEAKEAILKILEIFVKNKDYSKFAFKQRKQGIVNIVETTYIKINEVNKAANTLNKILRGLGKSKLTLPTAA